VSLILPAFARVTDRLGKEVQMSTKDYVAIASVVKAVGSTGGETGTLVALVIRLGTVFGDDNPAYRHDLFTEACGLDHLGDLAAVA
jgi:hypothetical protein